MSLEAPPPPALRPLIPPPLVPVARRGLSEFARQTLKAPSESRLGQEGVPRKPLKQTRQVLAGAGAGP